MYRIHCLNTISDDGLKHMPSNYELVDNLNQADAVLVRSGDMAKLRIHNELLAIIRAGVGVNNIPVKECAEKGIVICNTPGANANAVKELVILGMLLAARNVINGIGWLQQMKDDVEIASLVERNKKAFTGNEVCGKKLGVIGLGAIGVLVANAAASLKMKVYGFDPFLSVQNALNLSCNVKLVRNVKDIYKKCDYITLHVPLEDGTRGMLNKNAFEKMKDGTVILNFARAEIVDNADLRVALELGKVSKYITDLPTVENVNMPNTIVLPHLGAATRESEGNCAVMAVKQLVDYLENGNIANSVNYPDCSLGEAVRGSRICVAHRNVPNMIRKVTTLLGQWDLNICDMISRSRGDFSYAILDINAEVNDEMVSTLSDMGGILKVRLITKSIVGGD